MFDGLVQLKATVLRRVEIFYVLEHNASPVGPRLALEFQVSLSSPYAVLAIAYAQMGNAAEAIRAAEDTVRVSNRPSLLATAASALARVGQTSKARQLLGKALEVAKEQYICRFIVADAYADLGEKEKAFGALQKAFLQRST